MTVVQLRVKLSPGVQGHTVRHGLHSCPLSGRIDASFPPSPASSPAADADFELLLQPAHAVPADASTNAVTTSSPGFTPRI
jgi:hypothetical protein